jgi:Flp pilus assembly protein CpaB
MKVRYVVLIAVAMFGVGFISGAMLVGVPLFAQLMEARDDLAMANALTEDDPIPDPQVFVLVAKRHIPQWSGIVDPEEMFDVQQSSRRELPANAVTFSQRDLIVDAVKGRRVRAALEPGDWLTEDRLLKKEVPGIDAMLEKGKRAMSIPIRADRATAFFIVPGSKVDVVHSVDGKSQVILENVLVLAIDLGANPPKDKGSARATATVQLDNNEQALKLAACRDKGTLSLVMCAPEDDK